MYSNSLNTSTRYTVKVDSFIDALAYATASKEIKHGIKIKNRRIRSSNSVQSNLSGRTKSSKKSRSGKLRSKSSMESHLRLDGNRRHKSSRVEVSEPQLDERPTLSAHEKGETVNDDSYTSYRYYQHLDDEHLYEDGNQPDFSPPRAECQQRSSSPPASLTPNGILETDTPSKQRSNTYIPFAAKFKKKTQLSVPSNSTKWNHFSPHLGPPVFPPEKQQKKRGRRRKKEKLEIIGNMTYLMNVLMSISKFRERVPDCKVDEESEKKDDDDDGIRKGRKLSYDPASDPLYAQLPRKEGEYFPGEIVINPASSSHEPRVTVFCTEKSRSISPRDAAHATQKQHEQWARISEWGKKVGLDTDSLSREPEKQDRGRRRRRRWTLGEEERGGFVEDGLAEGEYEDEDDGVDQRTVWPDDSVTTVEERKRNRKS